MFWSLGARALETLFTLLPVSSAIFPFCRTAFLLRPDNLLSRLLLLLLLLRVTKEKRERNSLFRKTSVENEETTEPLRRRRRITTAAGPVELIFSHSAPLFDACLNCSLTAERKIRRRTDGDICPIETCRVLQFV